MDPLSRQMDRGSLRRIMLVILSMAIWIDRCPTVGATSLVIQDPGDFQAVQAVCGRCHPNSAFLNSPRPWGRWNDVFEQMTARSASGTDEQLARVTRYFLQNLTIVNVNTSPADEIGPVLGVSNDVAEDIVARRKRQKFSSLSDLVTVPGVDRKTLQQRKARIRF